MLMEGQMKIAAIDRRKAIDQSKTGRFEGQVSIHKLVAAPEELDIEFQAVFFAAHSRTRPHIHERDQILYVIEGQAIVATDTGKRIVSAGEVAAIPAGVWHWHGATADAPMCHISIKGAGPSHFDVEEKDWARGYDE